MLKTEAEGLDFQHLPRDLANVNAWKTMFDPYILILIVTPLVPYYMYLNILRQRFDL